MKKFVLLLGATLLASCATYEHKPTHILPYSIEFIGPGNAISPSMSGIPHTKMTEDGQPGDITYSGVFPLTHAVACSAGKTGCKHALIQTDLTYQIHDVKNGVQFTGHLKSKMARSITRRIEAQPGSVTNETNSIDDAFDIIGNKDVDTSFTFIYSPGKQVVIDGLEGAQVIFTFDAKQIPAA